MAQYLREKYGIRAVAYQNENGPDFRCGVPGRLNRGMNLFPQSIRVPSGLSDSICFVIFLRMTADSETS
jgi:hypothetical protein